MSARRELHALWSHCDSLRSRIESPGAVPTPDTARLLDDARAELGAALRRLVSAGMLTAAATRDLEGALAGLTAAREGRISPATAVARYGFVLQEVAAALHIVLAPPRAGTGNGSTAAELIVAGTGEVVDTLAFVTAVAAKGGHRLGGFSATGSGAEYRLTARCAGCGDLVSVHRNGGGAWSFTPVVRCAHPVTAPAAPAAS